MFDQRHSTFLLPRQALGVGLVQVTMLMGLVAGLSTSLMQRHSAALEAHKNTARMAEVDYVASEIRTILSDVDSCSTSLAGLNPSAGNLSLGGTIDNIQRVYYSRRISSTDPQAFRFTKFTKNSFVYPKSDPAQQRVHPLEITDMKVGRFQPLNGINSSYGMALVSVGFKFTEHEGNAENQKTYFSKRDIPIHVYNAGPAGSQRIRVCYAENRDNTASNDNTDTVIEAVKVMCAQMGLEIEMANIGRLAEAGCIDDNGPNKGLAKGRCKPYPICKIGSVDSGTGSFKSLGMKICEMEKNILRNSSLGGNTVYCPDNEKEFISGTPLSQRGFTQKFCEDFTPVDTAHSIPKIVVIGGVEYCRR